MIAAVPPLPASVRSAVVMSMSRRADTPSHGCGVLLRTPHGAVLTCAGRLETPLRFRSSDGRLVRFVAAGVSPLQWSRGARSPDGRWLLLTANLACDTSGAFVVAATGGKPGLVPRVPQGCDMNMAAPLGWTQDNRAVVAWKPTRGCGCRLPEGVYAVDPSTRRGRLIWRGKIDGLLQSEASSPGEWPQ